MNTREMLERMTEGDPSLEQAVREREKKTRLVRCLISMRAKAGLTQSEVAQKMKCSQSRVSKIEHGLDDDISIGELDAYTKAVGFRFELSFTNTSGNAAGLIKHHIITANALLQRIIKLAENDKEMLTGADAFSIEMLVNFCRLLDDTTRNLPNSSLQKILKKAAPEKTGSFGVNCNGCDERETVKA